MLGNAMGVPSLGFLNGSMVVYLTRDDLGEAFEEIETHYARYEEVPHYVRETPGMGKLLGVLEKVQMDMFYPSFLDKATYLLIAINKGHFFSNGNKRLALVIAIGFLEFNGKSLKSFSPGEYKEKLDELFGTVWFEEYSEFTPEEFALYHLSLIVAESHKYVGNDFDALKQKVHDFFAFALAEE